MRAISNIVTAGGGIDSTLTVTCSDEFIGETLTCTNGTKSITKTVPSSMNVVFNLSPAGTWVLSNSLTPVTSSYVVENIEYDTVLSNTPDGKTVLPTDDIQTWLNCANIWDKEYTTLAEVLADNDTLLALITCDNAVDYMVRSTSWAVAQALVPTMTSDTTPSGQVIYSSTYPLEGDMPYHCFDNNTSTNGCSALISSNTSTTWWAGYTFTSPTVINRAKITSLTMTRGSISTPIKIQGSNDAFSSDVHDLYSFDSVVSNADVYFNNDTEYTSYRLLVTANADSQSGEHYVKFAELQFYSASITDSSTAMQYISSYDYAAETLLSDSIWGAAIIDSNYADYIVNVSVPTMTSNTTPSGTVIYSQLASGYNAWNAFDKNQSTQYWSNAEVTNAYIGYTFPTSSTARFCKIIVNTNTTASSTYSLKIQGSNDAFVSNINDLTDVFNVTVSTNNSYVTVYKNLNNSTNYTSYRLIAPTLDASRRLCIPEIQFYGRQPGGVQTWLRKAGITDKNYTTLAEVLNDTTTLAALMANEDAVDYLVTCKGWTTAQALVPIMTSNTTPSGEAGGTSIASATYDYYKAFDENTSTGWGSSPSDITNAKLWYHNTSPSCIGKVVIDLLDSAIIARIINISVIGSNDGVTWTTLGTKTSSFTLSGNEIVCDSSVPYTYLGINCNGNDSLFLKKVQFYFPAICDNSTAMSYIGANNYAADTLLADNDWCNAICNSEYFESVLNVKVPTMTSNTTPSGVASASSILNDSAPAWKAFDGDDSTLWHSASGMPQWLKYDFGSQKKIYFAKWYNYSQSGGPIASKIQGSNDDSTWTDLVSLPTTTTAYTWANSVITEASAYRYYRFYVTETSYMTYIFAAVLQLYGREDV